MRWLAGVVALAILAAGGYVGYRHWHHASPHRAASPPPCPDRQSTVQLPPRSSVHVAVRNATLHTGLATRVAHELRRRQLHVTSVGNTAFRGKGIATVRYSADRRSQAEVVAAQIPGTTLMQQSGHGRLELDLGPRFHGLASSFAASEALTREVAATASPAPTPSCPS